ncbi:MAG: methyltransferase domain-containing protein [Blastochloris viridis]|uniref:Methyltransferase domain-containing protein n=1 Tax=Blastochloris viridis TaxID=1079 RepID=A0A6N4R4C0_BLAVI|nr:MAG: methyltransferase domain-containing protein [Blastochloris viridis]
MNAGVSLRCCGYAYRNTMQTQKNNIAFSLTLPERLGVCVDRVGGKRALAGLIGVSESQIFRYLNGLNEMTSDKLLAVARVAKVDPGWLLSGEGEMQGGMRSSDSRPAFRGELLVQITQLFEELLVEFEKPFNPRQRARAITFLYNALRHEETMRASTFEPHKSEMLKYLNFLAELRTEDELEILLNTMNLIEYSSNSSDLQSESQLLRTWCNLLVRGMKGYYSSYPGQLYFERRTGGNLEPAVALGLQNTVVEACTLTGKKELDWLDLGCGSGRHLQHIAKHMPNITAKGLELSHLGFNMCKELMDSQKIPAQSVIQGDMRQLPFDNESLDVVFAYMSLHSLPYIRGTGVGMEEAFSEITRTLRQNGILVAVFPYGNGKDYAMPRQYMNELSVETISASFGLKVKNLRIIDQTTETGFTTSKLIPDHMHSAFNTLIWCILQK